MATSARPNGAGFSFPRSIEGRLIVEVRRLRMPRLAEGDNRFGVWRLSELNGADIGVAVEAILQLCVWLSPTQVTKTNANTAHGACDRQTLAFVAHLEAVI